MPPPDRPDVDVEEHPHIVRRGRRAWLIGLDPADHEFAGPAHGGWYARRVEVPPSWIHRALSAAARAFAWLPGGLRPGRPRPRYRYEVLDHVVGPNAPPVPDAG